MNTSRRWLVGISLLGICLLNVGYGAESGGSAESKPSEINSLAITLGVLGGLAVFLFGIDQLAKALKALAGERMNQS